MDNKMDNTNWEQENRTEEIMVEETKVEETNVEETKVEETKVEEIRIGDETMVEEKEMMEKRVEERAEEKEMIVTETVEKIEEPRIAENYATVAAPVKKAKHGKKYIAAACIAVLSLSTMGLGVMTGQALADRAKNVITPSISQTASRATSTNNIMFTGSSSSLNYGVTGVVKSVANSVVSINVMATGRNAFNQMVQSEGAGSGIIFSEDKEKVYIVTNNHVVAGASKVSISIDDENQATANYVGSDVQSDIAVISVTKEELGKAGILNYSVAHFGNSDALEVGEAVVAIGNAAGEGKSATLGIVSAKNKKINIDGRDLKVIQTDAAINPGNSGGALVNGNGEVVGINTAKLSEVGIEGMGYSIPFNQAKEIIQSLITDGAIQRPYLGIQGMSITEEMQKMYGLPTQGVYVVQVSANGSAATAGLKAGDIIVGIGETKINTMEDLTAVLGKTKVGDHTKLYIYRNANRPMTLELTIMDQNKAADF